MTEGNWGGVSGPSDPPQSLHGTLTPPGSVTASPTSPTRRGKSLDIEFVFVEDETIRTLNREHRGKDEATDVLTFEAPDFPGAPLGEIVIAVPFAETQALLRKVSLRTELAYLAIHGVLHLCGFDDIEEADRRRMMAEMASVGEEIGLEPDREWTSIALGEPAWT